MHIMSFQSVLIRIYCRNMHLKIGLYLQYIMFNELHILTDSAYRLAGIAQLLPASRRQIGK